MGENEHLKKMLKILPFLTSKSDMNSRTRSLEKSDHLHTDILKPTKFHEILRISFFKAKTNISWTASGDIIIPIYYYNKH